MIIITPKNLLGDWKKRVNVYLLLWIFFEKKYNNNKNLSRPTLSNIKLTHVMLMLADLHRNTKPLEF